jgi:hypothetical protein
LQSGAPEGVRPRHEEGFLQIGPAEGHHRSSRRALPDANLCGIFS